MFERVPDLVVEHAELERRLADPAIHGDPARARKLGRRYAELGPIVRAYDEWRRTGDERDAALELAADDAAFAAEAEQLAARQAELEAELQALLLPRDPNDDRDVILEIKAGAGGEESALFAGDLLRMYSRYAERQHWRVEVLTSHEQAVRNLMAGRLGHRDIVHADLACAPAPRETPKSAA